MRETSNVDAYRLYLEGFYFREPAHSGVGGEKGSVLDPQYAPAFAGLADSDALSISGLPPADRWPKVEASFGRAINLDPNYATTPHCYGKMLSLKGRNRAIPRTSRITGGGIYISRKGSFAERGDAPQVIGTRAAYDPLRGDTRFAPLLCVLKQPDCNGNNALHPEIASYYVISCNTPLTAAIT